MNEQPVVGILSQGLEDWMRNDSRFDNYTSYIMMSYANYVQASGARVVPLILDEEESMIDDKLSKLNGILYPGGSGGYYDFG